MKLLMNYKNLQEKAVYINIGALMSMGDILMNRHISLFKQHNDNNICL